MAARGTSLPKCYIAAKLAKSMFFKTHKEGNKTPFVEFYTLLPYPPIQSYGTVEDLQLGECEDEENIKRDGKSTN